MIEEFNNVRSNVKTHTELLYKQYLMKVQFITEALDRRSQVVVALNINSMVVVYTDFCEAFDDLNYEILLNWAQR